MTESFWIKRKYSLIEKLQESIESSKFVSLRARMSGKFASRKELYPNKVEQKPEILVKPSFRELWNSRFSGLHASENMTISLSQERGKSER